MVLLAAKSLTHTKEELWVATSPSNRIRKAKIDLNAPLSLISKDAYGDLGIFKSNLSSNLSFQKEAWTIQTHKEACPKRGKKGILVWLLNLLSELYPTSNSANVLQIQSILLKGYTS